MEWDLSGSEARVGQLLGLGYSQKEIAFALGVSPSSVCRRVQSGARKLRLESRTELAAAFAAAAPRITATDRQLLLETLSPAELAVANLATLGQSDAEIARRRGASERTVENQLQSAYRKLGVHSCTELAARLSA